MEEYTRKKSSSILTNFIPLHIVAAENSHPLVKKYYEMWLHWTKKYTSTVHTGWRSKYEVLLKWSIFLHIFGLKGQKTLISLVPVTQNLFMGIKDLQNWRILAFKKKIMPKGVLFWGWLFNHCAVLLCS